MLQWLISNWSRIADEYAVSSIKGITVTFVKLMVYVGHADGIGKSGKITLSAFPGGCKGNGIDTVSAYAVR